MKDEEKTEEVKKTTEKKSSAKKTTTPKKKETEIKKKTTKKKEEEVKQLPEVVEEEKPKKKTTTKKTTTKKATTKKATSKKEDEVKEIPLIKDDVELEIKEEIEVEEVPEEKEETEKVVEEKVEVKEDTAALAVVTPVKEEKIIDEVSDDTIVAAPLPLEELGESSFDGKLIQLIGWYIIGFILSVVTLGLGIPFAKCFILDWRFKHTKINGKRLSFDGNGLQLWGNYIKWTFFSIITLGIFLLFLPVQWNKWLVKHTHYEGTRKPKVNYSLFDGITWEYIGISLLTGLLNLFSFGLLSPFCETLMYSWRINHTTYDTIDMEFDGKGWQLFGNYIKWTFLTIITLGIYGLWVPIRKIQWEVKHTHEKGYAKHPYRPILGMVLPIVFAIGCLVAQIYALTRVPDSKWDEIRTTIKVEIKSYKREIKKYDKDKVIAERIADIYYMINTKDSKITWDERYERYFDPNKIDKAVENYENGYFEGKVEMTIVDVPTSNDPVVIVKHDEGYRIFWLYEKKIENHYFNINDSYDGSFKIATDKNGERLAYVMEEEDRYSTTGTTTKLFYIDKVVDYDTDPVVSASGEKFVKELKDKNIKLADVELHYTSVNMDGIKGFKDAVLYYYDHTDKKYEVDSKVFNEDEVNDTFDDSTYSKAYTSYLKNKLNGEAKVAVLDLASQEYPSLVVLESNRSYILTYFDGELHESQQLGKASLGTLKKTTKSSEEYVLIASDNSYKYYYFVESYAEHKQGTYEGQHSFKIQKKNLTKDLTKYNYKETSTKVDMISISKNDLSALEKKLNISTDSKEEKKEEDNKEEESSIDSLKAGDYRLAFGDYVSDVKDITGGTYTILSNGSYSYVNPYGMKNGKKVTIRETGTYAIKMDYKDYIDGKGTGEKVPTICMKSSTSGSKTSEACWVVDKDNHFKAVQYANNWTYKK